MATASEPWIRIDLASPEPVYRQIANGLRTVLVSRALAPGDSLPTVRELAEDLGVHHNTVAEAYRLLAAEGWLDLKRRRGVRVLARNAPSAPPEARRDFTDRLRALIAEAAALGLAPKKIAKDLRDLADDLEE